MTVRIFGRAEGRHREAGAGMHHRAESATHHRDSDSHHGGAGAAGETGSYSFDVEPGWYRVTLNTEGYAPSYVGDILVKADSEPGTLNKFLMEQDEAQYYPKALAELEAVAAEILKRAEASAASGRGSEETGRECPGTGGREGGHRSTGCHRGTGTSRGNGGGRTKR
ncbi:putative tail fiber protein from prophage [Escherichia coli]|nr:putative tail fiber protein from prophage [Escherichia coli]